MLLFHRLRNLWLLPLAGLLLLAAACGGGAPAPVGGAGILEGTATARAATAAQEPAAQPTAVIPAGDLAYTTGRNADGTYFIGEPDAPVMLIDYSDFL